MPVRVRDGWRSLVVGMGLLVLGIFPVSGQQGPPRASPIVNVTAETPLIEHQVVRGDTLIAIARELLDPAVSWQDLASFNQYKRPDRLLPGTRVKIPVPWIKPIAVDASIAAITGELALDGRAVLVGDKLPEGSVLETGAQTVVTIALPDGSRLRVAPASVVRLERLRRYHGEKSVDALIRLERGRVEASAEPGRQRPLQIRSPFATAAVRGTDFRVGSIDALATAEVLTGGVAWSGSADTSRLDGGFGATADPQGVVSGPIALLPAPDLSGLPAQIRTTDTRLVFPRVEGAASYRIETAADARFEQPLSLVQIDAPEINLTTRNDGPVHLRVRAVASSRLEGFDARSVIQVNARPLAPRTRAQPGQEIIFDPVARLEWSAQAGVESFRVQLADNARFGNAQDQLVNGLSLEVPSPAGGGTLFWRVASIDSSGRVGPFGESSRIEWRAVPAAPDVQVNGERIMLTWSVPPAHHSTIELRWTSGGQERVRLIEHPPAGPVGKMQVLVTDLPPGIVRARLRWTAPDQLSTPFSPEVRWRVPDPIRSADGRSIELGSGGLVGSSNP